MSAAFEDIVETFDFLDDWEDRYRHIIELGKAMPDMDPALMVPATKVDGCASQVWIAPEIDGSGPKAVVRFSGTSDAMIVRGLIAVLHAMLNGRTAAEIKDIDAIGQMGRLGLDQHLSSQRSNGLRAMIARLKDISTRLHQAA